MFKKIRQTFVRDVAAETIRQLENGRGWREWLPPVAFHDCVIFTSKDGQIYKMYFDVMSSREMFTKIMELS